MKEYITCRICAKKDGPKPGFYYQGNLVRECECHQNYRETRLYELRAKQSGVWNKPADITKTYKGINSLDSRDQFIKYIENFKEYRTETIYITGPNGTQKTSIAMWGAFQLIKQGWRVQYILMYRLIELLTASFELREEYAIILEKLNKADLLVILLYVSF